MIFLNLIFSLHFETNYVMLSHFGTNLLMICVDIFKTSISNPGYLNSFFMSECTLHLYNTAELNELESTGPYDKSTDCPELFLEVMII